MLSPRPGFELPLKIADALNPILVLGSIIGLFLEYTSLKPWVTPVNQVIDIIFVFDFLIRLICFPTKKYFFKGYGWVDLLASLPGLSLLLSYTPFFSLFKVVRVGRFFKIIRVLRFLRIFGFLRRMRSDSPWIQDRIMKIGVTVVLVFVVGISLTDHAVRAGLEDTAAKSWIVKWVAAGKDPQALAKDSQLGLWMKNGKMYSKDGELTGAALKKWDELQDDENTFWFPVALSDEKIEYAPGLFAPKDALLINDDTILERINNVMIVLLGTMVTLLVFIIFYVGAIFARDMKIVHLVVDSADAEDYALLQDEAAKLKKDEDSGWSVEPGEDEMQSLLKMSAKLAEKSGGSDLGFGSAWDTAPEAETLGPQQILERLEALESRLAETAKDTALEALRIGAPAIIRFVKKEVKENP